MRASAQLKYTQIFFDGICCEGVDEGILALVAILLPFHNSNYFLAFLLYLVLRFQEYGLRYYIL